MALVGSAYVEIRALSAKFNKDIEKSLRDSLNGVGKDLGKQVGDEFADEYKKSVESKLGKKFKVPAPDTDEATEKIRKLGNESESMFTRMRKSGNSSIRSFSRSLKDMDNHLLHSFGTILKFGGGFSGLLMTLDATGAAIGSILAPLSALASGFIALSSAVAPAAKSAAILPGLLSAIITPAISLTLALSGVGKAYAAGAAAAAGGKKELEKYKEALEKLNPKQAEFVEHLLKHKDAIDDVKNAAAEQIFDGLSSALDRIVRNGFLDILGDGLSDAGGAIGYVADQVAKLTGRTFFQRSFSKVMDSNVVIIKSLGDAFVNLAGYFVLVADAARPFTEYFAAWIETITGNWLSKAKNDFSGLRGSIADGVQVAQQLGDIFGNIWEALGNIGRAARPAGRVLLNAFEGATEKLAEFTGSTKGQSQLREFFLNITDSVRAVGRLLNSVVVEFGKLGDNPAIVGMLNTLAESTVPKLASAMDKLVSAVGDDFVGILDTMAELGEIMAESGGIESYLEVMQGFLDVIKGILEIPGFADLAGKLLAITGAVKGLSLITKFTGLQWLVTTGLPGLKTAAAGKGKVGALARAGGAAGALGLLAVAIWQVNDAVAKSDIGRKLDLPTVEESANTVKGNFDRAGEASKEGGFGAGFKAFFEVQPADQAAADARVEWAKGIWDQIWDYASTPLIDWDAVWGFLSEPQTDIGKKAVDGLVKGVEEAWKFVTSPQVDWGKLWGNFTADVAADWAVIKRVTSRAWNSVTGVISGAVTRAKNAVTNTLGGMRIVATNNFNTVKRVAGKVWNGVTSTISGAVNRAKRAVTNTLGGMKIVATNIFQGIRKTASNIWNGITRTITNAVQTARRVAGNIFGAMRKHVSNIFTGIRRTAGNIWNAITRTVTNAVQTARRVVGNVLSAMRTNIGNIFRAIGKTAGSIWNSVSRTVSRHVHNLSNGVRGVLGRLRSILSSIWNGIRKTATTVVQSIRNGVVDRFYKMRDSVVNAFNSTKNGIRRAWNAIKGAASRPIKYVIDTVINDNLRPAFNKIAGVLPGVKKMGKVKWDGFSAGGYTGAGSKYQPAGVVHADEFVIKKESRKRIEKNMPGALDYMNQKGRMPGYAGGGLVDAAKWWRSRGAALSEHPSYGGVTAGGHMNGSLHYSGQAIDLNHNANETGFFDKWIPEFRKAFPSFGTIWRSAGHYNHAHIDTGGHSLGMGANGGGGGGGLIASLASMLNPIKKLKDKFKNIGGSGMLGDMVRGSGKALLGGAIRSITNGRSALAGSAGEFVGEIANNVKSVGAKATVRGLAMTKGWGFGKQWAALDWLVNKESSWNPNAANPSSSARGLFQKMTSIHGPVGNVLDQAKWGLNYIKDRYGNPLNAAKFHQSHGYYADGGLVNKIPTFDSGGILGKGLNLVNNATGGPEALVRPEQFSPKGLAAEYRALTKAIERAFGSSGPMSSAGSRVVSGLIAGMRSGAGAVASASSDIANVAIDTARTVLDIHSPSRVFRGMGLNIDRGLVRGVRDGRKELSKAVADTIDNILDYADDRVDKTADRILESFRRANQRISAQNKKIAAYNRTHKKDRNRVDSLQVPTRAQAEERAMDRLGYNKAGINKATRISRQLAGLTKHLWKDGTKSGVDYLLRAADKFHTGVQLYRRITLGDLAKGAENLAKRLETARAKLADIKKLQSDMSEEISSGISGTLDLTSASTVTDVPASLVSIKTISAQVRGLSKKARTLASRFKQLIRSGMPKAFIQEIAGLGIDEALTVSKAILDATGGQRKQLYRDYKAIDPAADSVGDLLAQRMYGVGLDAQRGLIRGLQSDEKSLTHAAKHLAKKLEREMKRALGIRSPSRVFAELGKFLPLGIAAGIESQTGAALAAVARLSGQMTDEFNPALGADASLSGLAAAGRRPGGDIAGADGLTARDRAIIAAIQDARPSVTQTINPPPEMDIFTLAKLVSREIEFRGK